MNIELEDIKCPMCDYENDRHILVGCDLLHGLPGEYNIVECNNCKLMRTNPRPSSETIGYYYPDDYEPYKGTRVKQEKQKKGKIKSLFTPIIHKVFDFKTTSIPDLPKGRMLEVGCASGAYMHKMAQTGWKVSGIEFSPEAAEATRSLGYDVFTGQLEGAPKPKYLYDIIVGWMVLEHLHDPKICLVKLNDWANSHASLVISVPDAGSFHLRLFKNMWHDLHLPNHLYHFTVPTIKKILLVSGWRVEKIHHHRVLGNLFASFGNVLKKRGYIRISKIFTHLPKYSNYFLFPLAWILSVFGQTGRMTIWARKIE